MIVNYIDNNQCYMLRWILSIDLMMMTSFHKIIDFSPTNLSTTIVKPDGINQSSKSVDKWRRFLPPKKLNKLDLNRSK